MTKILQLAYGEMGTYALEGLSENFNIVGIVSPPIGNNRYPTEAVRKTEKLAEQRGIPIYYDQGLKGLQEVILKTSPKAVVICSYDKVLPAELIRLSRFINIHHGDLPRYRGRENLNWAIINSRDSIGLTVHEAVPELDAGGIYKIWKVPILYNDYIADLYSKVDTLVRTELPSLLEDILAKKITPKKQRGKPTYCCTRLPHDGKINWNQPAEKIRNLIRGISKPFHGAYTSISLGGIEKLLTIWRADIPEQPRIYEGNIPGRVGQIFKGRGVEILTGTIPLLITDIHFEGTDYSADTIIKSTSLILY